jgi:hypothetical protein
MRIRVLWVVVASIMVSALEFAMVKMFRLYFMRWFPCLVWVCGSVASFWTYSMCNLWARYDVCFQSGSMSNVAM